MDAVFDGSAFRILGSFQIFDGSGSKIDIVEDYLF